MLVAVVYYANQHFTSKVITRDGRLWFYDGMAIANQNVQPTLKHVGFIHNQPDLHTCEESHGQACAAIYARIGV